MKALDRDVLFMNKYKKALLIAAVVIDVAITVFLFVISIIMLVMLGKYGDRMAMCERMPDALSAAMGNQMYTAFADNLDEVEEFIAFVQERAE